MQRIPKWILKIGNLQEGLLDHCLSEIFHDKYDLWLKLPSYMNCWSEKLAKYQHKSLTVFQYHVYVFGIFGIFDELCNIYCNVSTALFHMVIAVSYIKWIVWSHKINYHEKKVIIIRIANWLAKIDKKKLAKWLLYDENGRCAYAHLYTWI